MTKVRQPSARSTAAQVAAEVAQKKRTLNAAPGGKTCHILEHYPDNHIVALDIAPPRLQSIKQNMDRLNLNADLVAAVEARWLIDLHYLFSIKTRKRPTNSPFFKATPRSTRSRACQNACNATTCWLSTLAL